MNILADPALSSSSAILSFVVRNVNFSGANFEFELFILLFVTVRASCVKASHCFFKTRLRKTKSC